MSASLENIKKIRDETGLSIHLIKTALAESGDDYDKAILALREMGARSASKKEGRLLGAAFISAYVHKGGATGALVELKAETDFVSGNEEFQTLARDISMHVVAMRPRDRDELNKQSFIKEGDKTIEELLVLAVQKFGENIALGRVSWLSADGDGASF